MLPAPIRLDHDTARTVGPAHPRDAGRRRRAAMVTASAALLVMVGACSSTPSNPTSTTSVASLSTSTASSAFTTSPAGTSAAGSAAVSTAATSKPSTGSSGAGGSATQLTGVVSEGVESGCFILTDADGAVLANLIGVNPTSAPIGSTIEVTGKFQQDMMTTCQQGTPFEVATVQVK